jgi:hypothetical protein
MGVVEAFELGDCEDGERKVVEIDETGEELVLVLLDKVVLHELVGKGRELGLGIGIGIWLVVGRMGLVVIVFGVLCWVLLYSVIISNSDKYLIYQ